MCVHIRSGPRKKIFQAEITLEKRYFPRCCMDNVILVLYKNYRSALKPFIIMIATVTYPRLSATRGFFLCRHIFTRPSGTISKSNWRKRKKMRKAAHYYDKATKGSIFGLLQTSQSITFRFLLFFLLQNGLYRCSLITVKVDKVYFLIENIPICCMYFGA